MSDPEIIKRLNAGSWIQHFTAGQRYMHHSQVNDLFRELSDVLDWMSYTDIVLFQAGADPHINDPYGGWMTTEQLRLRDAMVFDDLAKSRTPVAWTSQAAIRLRRMVASQRCSRSTITR